jgi:hypothetical protein
VERFPAVTLQLIPPTSGFVLIFTSVPLLILPLILVQSSSSFLSRTFSFTHLSTHKTWAMMHNTSSKCDYTLWKRSELTLPSPFTPDSQEETHQSGNQLIPLRTILQSDVSPLFGTIRRDASKRDKSFESSSKLLMLSGTSYKGTTDTRLTTLSEPTSECSMTLIAKELQRSREDSGPLRTLDQGRTKRSHRIRLDVPWSEAALMMQRETLWAF